MNDEPQTSPTQFSSGTADATEVRFGIRAMLIAMAVVAVATSALGVFIRQFPADAQLRLAIYWGILAVIACGVIVFVARKRYLAEFAAGRVLHRFVPHSYFFPRAPAFAITLSGICCLTAAALMWAINSFQVARITTTGLLAMLNFNSIYGFIAFGAGISILWWQRILVTERGLLVRNQFFAWNECRRWYWDACNKNVAVIAVDKRKPVAVKITVEERAALQSLVDERIVQTRCNSLAAQSH